MNRLIALAGLSLLVIMQNASAELPYQAALVAPGMVEPAKEERVVSAEIVGVINEIMVEENDEVKAGQVIATISNLEQTAKVSEARANEAEALANLKLAQQELQRQRNLSLTSAGRQSDLDHAVATADASKAILERTAAQRKWAEAMLDKTVLRSPIDGRVLRRYILTGEAVTNLPPTRIISIGDVQHLRVRAQVDELDIGRLKLGQPVIIKADGYPDLEVKGHVSKITLRMDERTVQTSRIRDRVDTNILPVVVDVDPGASLPIGLRVDTYFLAGE